VKPYYQDDAVTIYHGDNQAVLPQLVGIDAVISDPPYGTDNDADSNRFSGGSVVRLPCFPNTPHPNQKPVGLMAWCIESAGVGPQQTILDPYMGSGTTLRAAKDLGRKAIGIEIEERYCEIAAKRMQQEVLAL
jgi:tRNA G10  N-methylase Trm11